MTGPGGAMAGLWTRAPGHVSSNILSKRFTTGLIKTRSANRTTGCTRPTEKSTNANLRMYNTVNKQTQKSMSCAELAQQIERLQPNASAQDVARLCLLLTNSVDDLPSLRDQRALHDAWKRTGLKLQVATDQHAAMTEELEDLAASDPQSFDQDQIWILIRAIKVQSQVLQMYVGHPLLDV